jgi:hypothetical protein
MDKTGWLVCNAFLNKLGGGSKEALIAHLPAPQKAIMQQLHLPASDISNGLQDPSELLTHVHYSWLSTFLRSRSENEIRLFLSCLPEQQARKLKKSLLFSPSFFELSPIAKEYLQTILVQHLIEEESDLLPVEALTPSKMNVLLTLSSNELHLLSEFLGLHDLAVEIRQIIDTVKLKKIHACLSKEKEFFLKILSHKKEGIVFKRIELQKWDGQCETLLTLLHHRGLNRLAKALYPEHPSLLWHLKHRMDIEDASLFSTLCKGLEHPKATTLLAGQILEILTYMQKIKS